MRKAAPSRKQNVEEDMKPSRLILVILLNFLFLAPAISEARLPPLPGTTNYNALKAADDLVAETIAQMDVISNLYGSAYYDDLLAQHTAAKQKANEIYYNDGNDLAGEDWQKFIDLAQARDDLATFLESHDKYAQDYVDRVSKITGWYSCLTNIIGNIDGFADATALVPDFTPEGVIPPYMNIIFSGWLASFTPAAIYTDTINFCNQVYDHFGQVGRPGSIFRTVDVKGCTMRSYSAYATCSSCSKIFGREFAYS